MSAEHRASQDDAFRAEICPECAYPLTGLPAGLRCPECGTACENDEVVLYGWGGGIGSCRPIHLLWRVAVVLAFAIAVWFLQRPAWLGLTCAACLMLCMALALMRRWDSPFPALLQARFSSAGCRDVDDLGSSYALHRMFWRAALLLLITVTVVDLFMGYVVESGTLGPLAEDVRAIADWLLARLWPATYDNLRLGGALMVFATGTTGILTGSGSRRGEPPSWTPWTEITNVTIEPMRGGFYLIRAEKPKDDEGKIPLAIDVRVRCTAEQASALRVCIERWRPCALSKK